MFLVLQEGEVDKKFLDIQIKSLVQAKSLVWRAGTDIKEGGLWKEYCGKNIVERLLWKWCLRVESLSVAVRNGGY